LQIPAHDLDALGDEAVKGAPACCLLKDVGALIEVINCAVA
jgi:hypothetical protein